MVKGKVTIEDLAIMMQRGFGEMHETFATKKDLNVDFVTKTHLDDNFVAKRDFKSTFTLLVDEIRLLRDDIKDMKATLVSISRILGTHDRDIRMIKQHVGIGE